MMTDASMDGDDDDDDYDYDDIGDAFSHASSVYLPYCILQGEASTQSAASRTNKHELLQRPPKRGCPGLFCSLHRVDISYHVSLMLQVIAF